MWVGRGRKVSIATVMNSVQNQRVLSYTEIEKQGSSVFHLKISSFFVQSFTDQKKEGSWGQGGKVEE